MEQKPVVIECRYRNSGTVVQTHFHNAYELLFIKQGRIRLHVGETVYDGGPGSVFLIGRFEEHFSELCTPVYERYYVTLDPEMTERLIPDRRLLAPLRSRPGNFCHRYDVSPHAERFDLIFRRLLSEARTGEPFGNAMCISLICELLILLCRQRAMPGGSVSASGLRAVSEIQSYIDAHFAEPLLISDLARRVYLTPCYLTHCFRELTGYSPKQYLVLARLAASKTLLLHTALPVGEVALRSGFSDVNNFIRTFRRETGLTPLRYRARGR